VSPARRTKNQKHSIIFWPALLVFIAALALMSLRTQINGAGRRRLYSLPAIGALLGTLIFQVAGR
jgi:hypothetical protein